MCIRDSFKPDEIIGDAMAPFVFNFPTVDVEEIDEVIAEPADLKVYPNPSNAVFNIELTLPQKDKVTIEIIDIVGSTIDEMEKDLVAGTHNMRFDATRLPSGSYHLRVKGKSIDEVRKLIKLIQN